MTQLPPTVWTSTGTAHRVRGDAGHVDSARLMGAAPERVEPSPPYGWLRARPVISGEALLALVCAYFVVACNGPLWAAMHKSGAAPGVQLSMAVAVFGLHAAVLGLVAWRSATRPLLAIVLVVTGFVTGFATRYAVLFDVDMVRNVLQTDVREAGELLSVGMVLHVLLAGLVPAAMVMRVRLPGRARGEDARRRALFIAAMLALSVLAVALSSQALFASVRADPGLRYRITPGNVLISVARAALEGEGTPPGPRDPVAADAHRVGSAAARRPRVLVLVVGETVRGDHWGLNGYARQTTPMLARHDVVNFPAVSACGTSTAVSLPCMFSAVGRADYDPHAIARQESLLDVAQRAGVEVLWRDNQSGCKGVCAGVTTESLASTLDASACPLGRCPDAALLQGLDARIAASRDDLLVVLHPLGNHGPNYFERYPAEFERFRPACHAPGLDGCSTQAIVNAYDNAILYTDAVLARLVDRLAEQRGRDTAMLYVSDHGESLGEYGLHLHGAPYAIAPRQQLHVPMILWMSPGFRASLDVDDACMQRLSRGRHSHDDLFHSVLGMFDIATAVYRPEHDVLAACRPSRDAERGYASSVRTLRSAATNASISSNVL